MLFYVGPSLLNAASPAGANLDRLPDHITLPNSATITYTDRATRRITTGTFGTVHISAGPPTNVDPHVYRLQRGRAWFITTKFTF